MAILDKIIQKLVLDYGYPRDQILKRFILPTRDCPDLVIFSGKQKNPIIVVEIKSRMDSLLGRGQIEMMMKGNDVKYGILTDGKEFRYYQLIGKSIIEIQDIPLFGGKGIGKIRKSGLKPCPNLVSAVFSIYDFVRKDSNFSSMEMAPEIWKLILCKIEDEESLEDDVKFFIDEDELTALLKNQKKVEALNRINLLFEKVKRRYPKIFDVQNSIKLSPSTIGYSISQLQIYSIRKTPRDILDAAFRTFFSTIVLYSFQYSTPTGISKFIVDLLDPKSTENFLDPACGFGNIMLASIRHVSREIKNIDEYVSTQVFGIEINKNIAELCAQNLLLQGYKDINIVKADFIRSQLQAQKISFPDSFDIIAVNPPFGRMEEMNGPIRNDYRLAEKKQKLESVTLFIERSFHLLKSSGRFAVITTPNILWSSSLGPTREFIINNFIIRAIIKLPVGTLLPYSGIQTCVLLLERKNTQSDVLENNVFMANIESDDEKSYNNIARSYHNQRVGKKINHNHILLIKSSELGDDWNIEKHILAKIEIPPNSRTLEEVADIEYGISVPSDKYIKENRRKGVPYIRISDLSEGKIILDYAKRIPKESTSIRLKEGDVLVSMSGTIGKIAFVEKSTSGTVPSSQLAILRPRKGIIEREYLFHILQSDRVRTQFELGSGGAFIRHFTRPKLKHIMIPVPNIKDQLAILKRLKTVKKKLKELEDEKKDLQKEEGRLINEIFKGGA